MPLETNPNRNSPVKKAFRSTFLTLAFVTLTTSAVRAENSGEVDFARDILPILSNKCFVCHGPDTHDETDLRLDSLDAATGDRGGYRAIDPGDPSKSEILVRIHAEDDPMPPRGVDKQLTETERDLISRWVMQGGTYAQHWAFVRPQKEAAYDTAAQAIDAYVGDQLEKKGIDFAPEAERSTLARRVSLVLTGLPPEPQLLEEYLSDDSQSAYQKLVEALLDSPRFGEHQARYWLDAVRYGDTHGLHLDNRRGIYPYRDWVVRAFNENLPLDDFIRWQIAGDLLPEASLEQKVATGYVRLNPSTGEGGAISEEFQMKNNFDRVETLGTVFLGMSLTCARCHTHKYDPIEQTEYYRLLAFFNSTAEPALDGNSYTYGPVAKVPADQDAWQQWRTLTVARDKLLASADETIDDFTPAIEYAVAACRLVQRKLADQQTCGGQRLRNHSRTRASAGMAEGKRIARNDFRSQRQRKTPGGEPIHLGLVRCQSPATANTRFDIWRGCRIACIGR